MLCFIKETRRFKRKQSINNKFAQHLKNIENTFYSILY